MTLIRAPSVPGAFGTEWTHSSWQRPPITTRSPADGCTAMLGPPARGLSKKSARGPEREDGHDALGPTAGEPVAMPAGAVLATAVEVEPEVVVANPVVLRQR